jgi:hypothetical protein
VGDVVLSGPAEVTDWQKVDFGEIREVGETERDAEEPALVSASDRERVGRPEQETFAGSAPSNLAGRASGGLAWIWSLFRTYGGARNDQASVRELTDDEHSVRPGVRGR